MILLLECNRQQPLAKLELQKAYFLSEKPIMKVVYTKPDTHPLQTVKSCAYCSILPLHRVKSYAYCSYLSACIFAGVQSSVPLAKLWLQKAYFLLESRVKSWAY